MRTSAHTPESDREILPLESGSLQQIFRDIAHGPWLPLDMPNSMHWGYQIT